VTRLRMTHAEEQRKAHGRQHSDALEEEVAKLAHELHLTRIEKEEASVGCALLYHHSNSLLLEDTAGGSGPSICPVPKTCQNKNGDGEHEAGAEETQSTPCDMAHFYQLKKSRDSLVASYSNRPHEATLAGDRDKLTEMLEMTKLNAELSVVGCTLTKTNREHIAESAERQLKQQQQQEEVQLPSFEPFVEDADQFNHFAERNHNLLFPARTPHPSSLKIKSLLHKLRELSIKRKKNEYVLDSAGQGLRPDIVWQERLSRERAWERVMNEERTIRQTILEIIQQRILEGSLRTNELDLSQINAEELHRQQMKEREEQQQQQPEFWDIMAKNLEEQRDHEQDFEDYKKWQMELQARKDMIKKQKKLLQQQQGQQLPPGQDQSQQQKMDEYRQMQQREMSDKIRQSVLEQSHKKVDENDKEATSSTATTSQECNNPHSDSNEQTCTSPDSNNDLSSSCSSDEEKSQLEKQQQMAQVIESMKKDMEFLRQKADEAHSGHEREARLSLVRDMERRIELLTNQGDDGDNGQRRN